MAARELLLQQVLAQCDFQFQQMQNLDMLFKFRAFVNIAMLMVFKKSIMQLKCVVQGHSGPENLKKSRQKNSRNQINFFREIAFLVVLYFFLVQKLIFSHF